MRNKKKWVKRKPLLSPSSSLNLPERGHVSGQCNVNKIRD